MRQIADIGVQTSLGQAHDVIVRHRPDAAQVGHGDDSASTIFHQWAGGLGQRREAVRADVVGDPEILTADAIQIIALQCFARCVGNGMDENVQSIPMLLERLEYCFDVGVAFHLAGQGDRAAQFSGHFLDAGLQLVILIGESKFGAFPVHRLGDAPGDGAVAGNPQDQGAFAGEKAHNELLCVLGIV